MWQLVCVCYSTCGYIQFFSIIATSPGPADYTSVSEPITFRPGTLTQTITVETVNDDIVEVQEQFSASLSVNSAQFPGVTIGTGPATIDIIDNDSEFCTFTTYETSFEGVIHHISCYSECSASCVYNACYDIVWTN